LLGAKRKVTQVGLTVRERGPTGPAPKGKRETINFGMDAGNAPRLKGGEVPFYCEEVHGKITPEKSCVGKISEAPFP